MTRGLIAKSLRETWVTTTLFALALAFFEAVLAWLIPLFAEASGPWMQLEIVQGMMKAMLGADVGGTIGPSTMTSVAWVHPMVLALVLANTIMFCTRLPAGEVDRGTIDVLLGQPVSRTQVYLCEASVWLASGLAVMAMGLLGHLAGGLSVSRELRTEPGMMVKVVANFYCLYAAVGGIAWLVSSLSDRRGRAVGIAFAVVVASLFLTFIAPFREFVERLSFLSVMNYYKPLAVMRDGDWPARDMLVLAVVGAVFWLAGLVLFKRRDICTV